MLLPPPVSLAISSFLCCAYALCFFPWRWLFFRSHSLVTRTLHRSQAHSPFALLWFINSAASTAASVLMPPPGGLLAIYSEEIKRREMKEWERPRRAWAGKRAYVGNGARQDEWRSSLALNSNSLRTEMVVEVEKYNPEMKVLRFVWGDGMRAFEERNICTKTRLLCNEANDFHWFVSSFLFEKTTVNKNFSLITKWKGNHPNFFSLYFQK